MKTHNFTIACLNLTFWVYEQQLISTFLIYRFFWNALHAKATHIQGVPQFLPGQFNWVTTKDRAIIMGQPVYRCMHINLSFYFCVCQIIFITITWSFNIKLHFLILWAPRKGVWRIAFKCVEMTVDRGNEKPFLNQNCVIINHALSSWQEKPLISIETDPWWFKVQTTFNLAHT